MIYSMFTGFMANLEKYGIDKAIDKALESGFSGVEFFFGARRAYEIPSPELTAEYKRKLTERGLSVTCVSVGATLIRPETPDIICEDDIAGLIRALEFTAAIGAKLFHHTLFMGFGQKLTENFTLDSKRELFYTAARRVADKARELGITILYEPQGPFFNGYREFTRLFYEMKKTHDNVGICCDLANSYWVDEEPYAIFEELAPYVRHVHLKDYFIDEEPKEDADRSFTGKWYIRQAPIGEGVIDFKRVIKLLKKNSYSGAASLEDPINVRSTEQTRKIIAYADTLFN